MELVFTGKLAGQWSYSGSGYLPHKEIQQTEKFLKGSISKSVHTSMCLCILLARMIPDKLYIFFAKEIKKRKCSGTRSLSYFQVRHSFLLVSQRWLWSMHSLKLPSCQFSICIFDSAIWKDVALLETLLAYPKVRQFPPAEKWAELGGPATTVTGNFCSLPWLVLD